ncbi:MAG: response regulator transcription factor [Acidimicrobiia bacterium]
MRRTCMSVAIFTLISINSMLFALLGLHSFRLGRRSESPYLGALAGVVTFACAAFVLGALQRLAVQAVAAGWLPDVGLEEITTQWQLLQSLAAFAIAIAGFWVITRTMGSVRISGQVAALLAGKLPDVDLDSCGLTPREREIVEVIGSGVLSDKEIADALYIAPSTAATHVKRILRKTGLTSRRDLLLFFLAQGR